MPENDNTEFDAYHPFLTFSNPDADRFVLPNREPGPELDKDSRQLFDIAKDAYQMLPTYESRRDFDSAYLKACAVFDAVDKLCAQVTKAAEQDNQPLSQCQIDRSPLFILSSMPIAAAVHSLSSIPTLISELCSEILPLFVLKSVDNALRSKGLTGSIFSAIMAAQGLDAIKSVEYVNKGITGSKRIFAKKGANKRLNRDPKQQEKAFILECWKGWQESPSNYKSKAAFARDMLTKCEHLTSQKKIEDWCRQWEREAIGTKEAE